MPGMTAYTGLLNIGQPKGGETLVVAAASGPVGSAVGQIGKIKGCRAVGIAGGTDKCRYLAEELGFDAAVDHRAPDFAAQLKASLPRWHRHLFRECRRAVWDAVFPLLNAFARIPVCGLVALYSITSPPEGPDRTPLLMRAILTRRLTLRGFIVGDFAAQAREFARDMGEWVQAGRIRYREDVAEGLENAPDAFIGMLKGRNFGRRWSSFGNAAEQEPPAGRFRLPSRSARASRHERAGMPNQPDLSRRRPAQGRSR